MSLGSGYVYLTPPMKSRASGTEPLKSALEKLCGGRRRGGEIGTREDKRAEGSSGMGVARREADAGGYEVCDHSLEARVLFLESLQHQPLLILLR